MIENKKPSLNQKYIKNIVKNAMLEDLRPHGDVTTQLIKNKKKLNAIIISNQTGIIGGLNFAKEAFKYSDKKINFKTKTKDGRKINKGKIVASITGTAKEILKSERVALNFLSLVSGVATITNKFVTAVKGKSCKICCTRKTIPNLRLMQKYAVKLGGGLNHRFNLSDEYLNASFAKFKPPIMLVWFEIIFAVSFFLFSISWEVISPCGRKSSNMAFLTIVLMYF